MPAPLSDVWPRKPVEGITALLQPVAHVLLQVKAELPGILVDLSRDQLWAEPAGVPSVGFHLAHLAGSLDRFFTHARGQPLTPIQHEALTEEGAASRLRPGLADLLGRLDLVLDDALAFLRFMPPERLLETRDIGAGGCFATVFDLVYTAAEHTSRHMGQIVATATLVRRLDRSA